MREKTNFNMMCLAVLVLMAMPGATCQARMQAQKDPYPAMAPLEQYLMPDEKSEIALARSAAPVSISDGAEVMVLGRKGYTTAVKGTNGFLCIVERSWGATTDHPEFWNPKVRGVVCFNPPAARSFVPIYLMKTRLVLAGKSKKEIVAALASAFEKKPLEKGWILMLLDKLKQKAKEREIKSLSTQVRLSERLGDTAEQLRLLEKLQALRAP